MKNKIKRNRILIPVVVLLLLSLFSSCATMKNDDVNADTNYVYQVSTLQALMEGGYAGAITSKELITNGDTGLGTFDDLDGEMIVLDGKVYKASTDGSVTIVDDNETIPFANVAFLTTTDIAKANFSGGYDGLKELLNNMYPEENMPILFYIKGDFNSIEYRSVPEQQEPYPDLTVVVKDQVVFNKDTASGTLVGFRFSSYMGDINTSGYHLHFISDDKSFGGHLLSVQSGGIEIKSQTLTGIKVYLPDTITDMDFSSTTEDDIGIVEGE